VGAKKNTKSGAFAAAVFDAFGGAYRLSAALKALGPQHARSVSSIYRWALPRAVGGADGQIPSSAMASVRLAARMQGVVLPEDPPAPWPETFAALSVTVLPRKPVTPSHARLPLVPLLEDHQRFWDRYDDEEQHLRSTERMLGPDFGGRHVLAAMSPRLLNFRRVAAYQNMAGAVARAQKELEESSHAKVVVYTETGDLVTEIAGSLREVGALRLYSRGPRQHVTKILDRFQHDASARVLVCPPERGPALTCATHVIFLEFSWSVPEVAAAVMRVHRAGNSSPVRVYFIAAKRSIELSVVRALAAELRTFLRC
jgi:hypothetical protein